MKKVLFTLALFTLGVVFANANENCVKSAIDAYEGTEEDDSAYDNMVNAYDDCVRNGGSPGDNEANI